MKRTEELLILIEHEFYELECLVRNKQLDTDKIDSYLNNIFEKTKSIEDFHEELKSLTPK